MKGLFTLIFVISFSTAFGQYVNQTKNLYSDKEGNLFVIASYTSTNGRMADRTIYLKSRNVNSKSKEMLTWTNGGLDQVERFLDQLMRGFDRGTGSTFQVNFMYVAHVEDTNTIKVNHKTGGVSYFNKTSIQRLQHALKGIE